MFVLAVKFELSPLILVIPSRRFTFVIKVLLFQCCNSKAFGPSSPVQTRYAPLAAASGEAVESLETLTNLNTKRRESME
jgi:hypothetical protein